ncbi:MAG: hypothetical protein JW882_19880 [Deltaproteobacteria bacterium]|nr:hypothetical protein [Deltaproteobacteria bacterium]
MKVYESGISLIKQKAKHPKVNKGTSDSFKEIMCSIRPRAEDTRIMASGSSEIRPIDGVKILHRTECTSEMKNGNLLRGQLVKELYETLDLIDFYSERLADISKPSSELDSLLGHLEDRIDSLRLREADPGTPEKLKSIISGISVTMGTEIAKFRRGDYF